MPTTTLALGAVGFISTPLSGQVIAGDPPQWADGSDASYAYIFGGGSPATAQAAPVAGNMTGWTVTIRASSTPGFGADPISMSARMDHPDSGAFLLSEGIVLPNDGTVYEVTVSGQPEYVVDPGDNPAGWMALGPFVTVANNSFGSRVYVYEVTVVVTTLDEGIRVTRQFPRDDEYGLGSAPRIFPPPRGGRIYPAQL